MIMVGNPAIFGLFMLLSVARQYIRIEALIIGIFCDSQSCSDGTYTWDTDNNMVYVYDSGEGVYHLIQFSYLINIGMSIIGFSVGFLLTGIVMFVLIFFIKPKEEGETS